MVINMTHKDEMKEKFSESLKEAENLAKLLEDPKKKDIPALVMSLAGLDSQFNVYQNSHNDDSLITEYINFKRSLIDNKELHEERMKLDPDYAKAHRKMEELTSDPTKKYII